MLNLYDLSFSEIYKVIPNWKWCELKQGYELSIISKNDILLYAGWILEEGIENFDLIIDLIIYENLEEILPQLVDSELEEILPQLVDSEYEDYLDIINSKWLFAIIYTAFLNCEDKIFDIIEDLYVEFDYPEEISSLIAYMPMTNNKSMKEELMDYIKVNKSKWCSD